MSHFIQRILIVDDQPSIRRTMAGIIEDLGHEVVEAEDGYHAIDHVKNDNFDFIFLDIKMPGINGVQTLREIKKMRPETLAVMMTGYEVEELIVDALNEGAMAVMYKPLHPEQLVRLLQSTSTNLPADLPEPVHNFVANCRALLAETAGKYSVSHIALRVADSELKALRLVAAGGPAAAEAPALTSLSSIVGLSYSQSATVAVADYSSHPLNISSEVARGVKSYLAIPFRSSKGDVVGSVEIGSFEPQYFTQETTNEFISFVSSLLKLLATAELGESELLRFLSGFGSSTERILV